MTKRAAIRFLAAGVIAAMPAAVALAQPATDGAIRLVISEGLPEWGKGGGWTVVPDGGPTDPLPALMQTETIPVRPGTYDVYWVQDADHLVSPMLYADDVVVEAGETVDVAVRFQVEVAVADWVPPLTAAGYWGAIRRDDNSFTLVNWANTADPIVLPEGNYDFYWDPDPDNGEPAIFIENREVEPPYGGLGMEVRGDPRGVLVLRPMPGGPAEAAGLQANDLILSADDVTFAGMALTDAVGHLRGPGGTSVTLTVERGGETLEIAVTREIVEAELVIRVGSGILLDVAPNVPPLGSGGWWGVVYTGESPDRLLRFEERVGTEPLLLGQSRYDVYWRQNGNSTPVLVAEDVFPDGEVVTVEVSMQALSDRLKQAR